MSQEAREERALNAAAYLRDACKCLVSAKRVNPQGDFSEILSALSVAAQSFAEANTNCGRPTKGSIGEYLKQHPEDGPEIITRMMPSFECEESNAVADVPEDGEEHPSDKGLKQLYFLSWTYKYACERGDVDDERDLQFRKAFESAARLFFAGRDIELWKIFPRSEQLAAELMESPFLCQEIISRAMSELP